MKQADEPQFMNAPTFQPGFRLSKIDGIVIIAGSIGSAAIWPTVWWVGFIIAFVVAHFFVFCNIFRVSRSLELMWGGVFVILTICTITFEKPSWLMTIIACLSVTFIAVAIEMRKPSYHGILWKRINPNLPQWWEANGGVLS